MIVIKELELHRERQIKEKKRLRGIYRDENLIFPNPIGEKLDTSYLYRIHCKALENADIPHTAFHNLRHSVATLLNQAGENQKSIQELLGHADAETTADYTHILDEMKVATANTIEGILQEILFEHTEVEQPCLSPDLN